MTKVEGQVAKRDTELSGLTRMIASYEGDYARVLPSHVPPSTFVRLAQGVLRRNEDLAKAAMGNPNSLLVTLLDCAELGHRPGSDEYALTMRRVNSVPTIVGIEQYQGVMERMFRAGAVLSIKCEVVRSNDHFDWAPTRMQVPIHEYDALASAENRGELVGVYAYAEMQSGMQAGATSRVVVMAADEVARHRAYAGTPKFWDAWPDPMWRKTALHELEKWVPTSSEYLMHRARAGAAAEAATRPGAQASSATEQTSLHPQAPTSGVIEGQATVDGPEPAEADCPEAAKPGDGGNK